MKNLKKLSFVLAAALVFAGSFFGSHTALAGTLTATNVEPASLVTGTTNQVTVTFSTIGVIPPGGKVKVTFGAGFNVAGANGGICPSFLGDGGISGFTTTVADQVVTIARVAGTATVATHAETCTIEGIVNPVSAGSTGTYTITTTDPSDVLIDNDTAVAADTITDPAATITSATVTGPNQVTIVFDHPVDWNMDMSEFTNLNIGGAKTGLSASGSPSSTIVIAFSGGGAVGTDATGTIDIAAMGNHGSGYIFAGVTGRVLLDAQAPTVITTVSQPIINIADDGAAFDVIATFSEPMNVSFFDEPGFSEDIVGSNDATHLLGQFFGDWNLAHTVFTRNYVIHSNIPLEKPSINVTVSGARDVAGNLFSSTTTNSLFAVDTIAPTVVSAHTVDFDSNGKIDYVVVTYSEPVNDPDYNAVAVAGYTLSGTGASSGTATLSYNPVEHSCTTASSTLAITITNIGTESGDGASGCFAYSHSQYLQSGSNQTPTITTGVEGGTFSSAPAGLVINPSTGTIIAATSSLGDYTVTYTADSNDRALDTGVTPALTFTDTNAADLMGNNLDLTGAPISAADGANPAIVSAQTLTSTTFEIVFSEPILFSSIANGDLEYANAASGGFTAIDPATEMTPTADASIYTVSVAADNNPFSPDENTGQIKFFGVDVVSDASSLFYGNTQTAAMTITDGITAVAPTVAITSPSASDNVNASNVITFTDDGVSPECSVNGTDWIACTSGVTTMGDISQFAGLGEGDMFTFYLRDTNSAGTGADQISIIKNTSVPVVSNTAPINSAQVGTSFSVEYTLSEAVADGSITFSRTSGSLDGMTHSYDFVSLDRSLGAHQISRATLENTFGSLVDGAIYSITYYAIDAAGNVASTVINTGVLYDTSSPTVNVGSPSAASTNAGPIAFIITYSGADTVTLSNTDITLNATGTVTADYNVTGSGLTTRTVTISNITGDGTLGISIASGTASYVGNLSAAAGPSTTFDVDNISPLTPTVTPVVDTYTSTQSVTLSSTGSASIRYTIDGTDPSTCSSGTLYVSPISVSSSLTINARGCDAAGNISTLGTFVYTVTSSNGSHGGGLNPNLNENPNYNSKPSAPLPILKTIPQKISISGFIRNLKITMSGDDVKALQIFLNTHGFILATSGNGSPGNETNYFGRLTKEALIKFQEKYKNEILIPLGLASPTGIMGSMTIRQMNKLIDDRKLIGL